MITISKFTQEQYSEIWDMIFSQTGYPINHPKHEVKEQPQDTFWTDELVHEFGCWFKKCSDVFSSNYHYLLDKFKASKQQPIEPIPETKIMSKQQAEDWHKSVEKQFKERYGTEPIQGNAEWEIQSFKDKGVITDIPEWEIITKKDFFNSSKIFYFNICLIYALLIYVLN